MVHQLSGAGQSFSLYCRLSIEQTKPQVNCVVCQLLVVNNVLVDITIFRHSFVFSKSRVKVSASLVVL